MKEELKSVLNETVLNSLISHMEMFAIRSVISILIIACIIKYYETFLPYNISVYVKECFEDAASDVPPEAYMTTVRYCSVFHETIFFSIRSTSYRG